MKFCEEFGFVVPAPLLVQHQSCTSHIFTIWNLDCFVIKCNNSHTETITFARKDFEDKMTRRPGVATPEDIRSFVDKAGDALLVIDLRNPDATMEPEDQPSLAVAPLPSETYRPRATHFVWDREKNDMPLPDVPKDTPIITHCGAGGRGQMAKELLEKHGFRNVINGGGPKVPECWAEFGNK